MVKICFFSYQFGVKLNEPPCIFFKHFFMANIYDNLSVIKKCVKLNETPNSNRINSGSRMKKLIRNIHCRFVVERDQILHGTKGDGKQGLEISPITLGGGNSNMSFYFCRDPWGNDPI